MKIKLQRKSELALYAFRPSAICLFRQINRRSTANASVDIVRLYEQVKSLDFYLFILLNLFRSYPVQPPRSKDFTLGTFISLQSSEDREILM